MYHLRPMQSHIYRSDNRPGVAVALVYISCDKLDDVSFLANQIDDILYYPHSAANSIETA